MTRQHLLDMGVKIMPMASNHLDKITESRELQPFGVYWHKEEKDFVDMFKSLLVTYGWKVRCANSSLILY